METEARNIQKETSMMWNKKEILAEKPTDEEMKSNDYPLGFVIEAHYSKGDLLKSLSTEGNNLEKIKGSFQVSFHLHLLLSVFPFEKQDIRVNGELLAGIQGQFLPSFLITSPNKHGLTPSKSSTFPSNIPVYGTPVSLGMNSIGAPNRLHAPGANGDIQNPTSISMNWPAQQNPSSFGLQEPTSSQMTQRNHHHETPGIVSSSSTAQMGQRGPSQDPAQGTEWKCGVSNQGDWGK